MEDIEKVVSQAKELTSQLQLYAQDKPSSKNVYCLKELCRSSELYFKRYKVLHRFQLPGGDMLVEVNRTQIKQVFSNILLNAVRLCPQEAD